MLKHNCFIAPEKVASLIGAITKANFSYNHSFERAKWLGLLSFDCGLKITWLASLVEGWPFWICGLVMVKSLENKQRWNLHFLWYYIWVIRPNADILSIDNMTASISGRTPSRWRRSSFYPVCSYPTILKKSTWGRSLKPSMHNWRTEIENRLDQNIFSFYVYSVARCWGRSFLHTSFITQ